MTITIITCVSHFQGGKIINFVALSTLACITVQFVESTGAEKKDLSTVLLHRRYLTGSRLWSNGFLKKTTKMACSRKSWHAGGGPEQGFQRCFTDGHYQKFSFILSAGYVYNLNIANGRL